LQRISDFGFPAVRRATGTRIHGLLFALVWRAQGAQHVLPGARARIDEAAGAELLKGRDVMGDPGALVVGRIRPAHVRPLTPAQAKPAQVLEHRIDKLRTATWAVEIVVAQDERAARGRCALLGDPKRARVTEVRKPVGEGARRPRYVFR